MTTTPMWLLLDERLGGELGNRLLDMRAEGLSLDKIARQLSNETA